VLFLAESDNMNSNEIAELLKKASDAYYGGGAPIMSDQEFDALRDRLLALDPSNPFLRQVGAPIKLSAWPKKKHDYHMGSLSKVNVSEEYLNWAKGKDGLVQVSHKLDGSTIALTYDRGKLLHAVTRGDGDEGEEITPNVLQMANVKESLSIPFSGVLRGEMILSKSVFATHFSPKGYKNPRNAANGCARDKKGNGLLKHIQVIYFDLKSSSDLKSLTSEELKEKFVRSMGLEFVSCAYMGIDKVWAYFESFDRGSLPHEIDGLVVKLCDMSSQEAFGVVDGRPKGQIAIKFEAETATTKLNSITWQVGLSGRITPVAELEPIDLGGVTISRSTLNNLDYINALGVEIGDIVEVARLNDVIPGIVKVVSKSNSGQGINLPTTCPTCNSVLERDGAYIICPFTECAGAVFGDMVTWIKTHGMLGFGRVIISELIERGITTPDKLYTAWHSTLMEATGSPKIAEKLKAAIEQTRSVTLDKFLAGFNIPHLGKTNSKRLAKKFGTYDSVMAATVSDLEEVEGIKTTAKKIHDGLHTKKSLMERVMKEVKIQTLEDSGPLKGKSFAMTGLRNIDGKDVAELISSNGGEVKSGVSKGLDFLIIKDPNSTSNKAEKARQYGTVLISPENFMKMIGE